ncbi:hypothetical protein ACWN8V_07080 [Vagococcus elongatus]|uniref:Uncharacterized protein n=1 Tax=Vagococcus elongatus TaxID=180344 RepID=A0A430AW68_9ENTE|nr:hypothetical protein [Vagococcus elongatus]RSU12295.1 hypothetical protein CBF29_06755 [Vagococcus elongatus]
MIINPVILYYEEKGVEKVVAFEREFVEKWLDGVTDGQQDLEFFLTDYTYDDVEALVLEKSLEKLI